MNNRFQSEDKIILAIDGLDLSQAKLLLEKCPHIKWVKVGLELFVREGPRVIEILKGCLLYTSPSPRDSRKSRMPSSA